MNRESRLYLLANLKASISSTLLRWNSTLSPLCSCPGSTFSGWKLWLCTYRNSPQCCWIDDLSQYRYVFSSCTAPISHSASLCSHCRNSTGNQMSLGWPYEKSYLLWLQHEVVLSNVQKSYFTHIFVIVVYLTFHSRCSSAHIRQLHLNLRLHWDFKLSVGSCGWTVGLCGQGTQTLTPQRAYSCFAL